MEMVLLNIIWAITLWWVTELLPMQLLITITPLSVIKLAYNYNTSKQPNPTGIGVDLKGVMQTIMLQFAFGF